MIWRQIEFAASYSETNMCRRYKIRYVYFGVVIAF